MKQPARMTGSLIMTANDEVMVFCNTTVSELIRDIKSPVRDRAKKLSDRFCKWENNRVRRSVMVRMATHCRQ